MTIRYQIINEIGWPIGNFGTKEHATEALIYVKKGKIREVEC